MKTKKVITKEQVKLFKQMAKKGASQREIAKKFKCSRSSVYYWLHK